MIEKRAWTRDELLVEVARAVHASLHPEAESLIAEIEKRTRLCGERVTPTGRRAFCLRLDTHPELPHRGVGGFGPRVALEPGLDLEPCCEASPIFSWED